MSYTNAVRDVRARETSEERTVMGYATVIATGEGRAQDRFLHRELHKGSDSKFERSNC